MNYPIICGTRDKKRLFDELSDKSLSLIENVLSAYQNELIDFAEPRGDEEEPDPSGDYKLIIHDKAYKETGLDLLIMKWYEDLESTDHFIDVMHKAEGKLGIIRRSRCKFCQMGAVINNTGDDFSLAHERGMRWRLCAAQRNTILLLKVKYCPICGRKLKKKENDL